MATELLYTDAYKQLLAGRLGSVSIDNWGVHTYGLEQANLAITAHAKGLRAGDYHPVHVTLRFTGGNYCKLKFYVNAHDAKGFSIAHNLEAHAIYAIHPSLN